MNRITKIWIDLQQGALDHLDRAAVKMCRSSLPHHLATGIRGERAALFHLRRNGYIIVAQRWTNPKVRGDVDLIGWDEADKVQPSLCFIEVKTRTMRDMSPAESAVDRDKQRTLRSLARAYLRAFPEESRRHISVRFDVVSVYLLESGTEYEVFPGAFSWH